MGKGRTKDGHKEKADEKVETAGKRGDARAAPPL